MMKKIVFACVHNAGRSQIAAGWARHLAGGRLQVVSAGTQPGPHLNVQVVAAMREAGIDLNGVQLQERVLDLLRSEGVLHRSSH